MTLVDLTLDTITCSSEEPGVFWIRLNRPDAANSRNQQMREELSLVYAAIRDDEEARALVLIGQGSRFFCAGMDMKEAGRNESPLERRNRLRRRRDIEELAQLPIPTIAAINGYALGGGLEMALACDLRYISTDAKIGLPEVTHGLTPGGGATQRLPRLVGFSRAAEMIYLGQTLGGVEAVQAGLANAYAKPEELESVVAEVVASMATHPVRALRAAKQSLLASQELPLSAGLDRELDELLFLLAER